MVDPNTGDWSFRIDDEVQKQAYLNAGFTELAFIETYKKLLDNAVSSFGYKYVITAVGPIDDSLVTDKYFAVNEVINYAFEAYRNQLIIAKGSLNTNTPDPEIGGDLRAWQIIWDSKPHCAGQLVWSITNETTFKMNGGNPYSENEKKDIFKKALDIGINYGLNCIEPWFIDVLNPDLQNELEYARNRLYEN